MKLLNSLLGGRLALVLQGELPLSLEREEGQTLVEYALILALIAILVAASLTFLKGTITDLFTKIGSAI